MSEKIKTIFFGTHHFAREILQSLIEADNISIDLVITKPDKRIGRSQKVQKTPVKKLAKQEKLAIDQPEDLDNYKLQGDIDIGITAQYGKIIPKHILDFPKYGMLNVHTSLLPKYRGAAPIQTAILNGEPKTGVTIMKMDEGLDTGPILLQKSLEIGSSDKFPDVNKKMSQIASDVLLEAIGKYTSGELQPQPQNEDEATITNKFTREDGKIDWQNTTEDIYNKYRAFTPWPGIWTTWEEKRVKLKKIKPSSENIEAGKIKASDTLLVGTTDGSIEIKKIQLEGKQEMEAQDFLNGYGDRINDSKFNT